MINNVQYVNTNIIANFPILGIFILSFFALLLFLLKNKFSKYHLILMIGGLLFLSINFLNLTSQIRSFIVAGQFIMVFVFFIYTSLIKWNYSVIKLMSYIAIVLISINFLILVINDFGVNFSGFFINPNTLGVFTLLLYYFYLIGSENSKKRELIIISLMVFVLIYSSSSRTILLSLVAIIFTYYIWKWITSNKFIFISYIIIFKGILISVIFVYPQMKYWSNYAKLNELMWKYTGKNLLSGRETIWENVLNAFYERPWLGYGTGTILPELQIANLSTHNLYLQISYQLGIIGLILFLFILTIIWLGFWFGRQDFKVKISAAFFVGILVQQSFEVTLTQNNMAIAMMQWLIFGFGIAVSLNYPNLNINILKNKNRNR